MLSKGIAKLVQYGVESGLVPECEKNYTTNLLLDVFHEDEYTEPEEKFSGVDLEETLNELLDEAVKRGLIEDSVVYRDLFDTRLMNCLMPRPAQVQKEFWDRYQDDPQKATDYFYKLSQDSNYIRRYRVKKDQKWKVDSPYGEIDITINLSKPEKDPKAIAAAKNAKASSYPKCLLCPENEGYAGRVNHPARQNHRIIPITINDTPWGFQYSPYVYYNEHCIVFNSKHTPMKIERNAFIKLFDFVKLFANVIWGNTQIFLPISLVMIGGWLIDRENTNDTMKNLLTVPVSYPKLLGGKLIVTIFLSILFGIYSVAITVLTGTLAGLDGFSADVLLRQGAQVVAAAFNTSLVCMPMILIFGQMRGAYLGGSLLTFFLGYCILFFKSGFLLSAYPFSAALILAGFDMQEYNGATQAPSVSLAVAGIAAVLVLTMAILLLSRPSKKAGNNKKKKVKKGRGRRRVG